MRHRPYQQQIKKIHGHTSVFQLKKPSLSVLFVQNQHLLELLERSHECCLFACLIVCFCHHEQGQQVWQQCLLHHEPTFLCSSWLKSETTWLHPEELKSEAAKCLRCVNVDRTTPQSLQWKCVQVIYIFRPTPVFVFPFKLSEQETAPAVRESVQTKLLTSEQLSICST